jgi:hypothetical protein
MRNIIFLFVFACFLTSCNVTESIVFNNDMSGDYQSSFDMSPMMQIAGSQGPSKPESEMKKMDTTIVFNDLYETHKDSIAALSSEEKAKLEKLKGTTVKVNMDEANNIFEFSIIKPFKSVNDLKHISEQMDDAMGIVKDIGNEDGAAPAGQMDELTKIDEVSYTFINNTFSRFEPKSLAKNDEDSDTEEEAEEADEDDFGKQLEMQFEEIFSSSYYTMVYKFPRNVKSVSHEGATISEDGKTVTYKVPWNTIQKDKSILNLNVVLED